MEIDEDFIEKVCSDDTIKATRAILDDHYLDIVEAVNRDARYTPEDEIVHRMWEMTLAASYLDLLGGFMELM